MRAYVVIGALTVLAVFARVYAANTEDRTSAGLNCTADCSGYDAGYKWAEQRGIDDEDYCPDSDKSFYEGCVAYVAEPFSPSEADNGKGVPTPLSPDDQDDDDDN